MATIKVVVVLAFCAFAFNEANASALATNQSSAVDLLKLRHHFERSEQEHANSMSAIMQGMTSHSALEILRHSKHANPELLALAQAAVSHTRLRSSMVVHGLKTPVADRVKGMLNSLLEETMTKYDLEILKCRDYYSQQCGLIEQSRGSIAASNFQVSACRTHILAAQTGIAAEEASIPPAKEALKEHRVRCKTDIAALRAQLSHLGGDIATMTRVLKMTDCGSAFIQTEHHVGKGVNLLHCEHKCDHGRSVSFDHAPLMNHIDSLKSSAAQQLLQESFSDLGGEVAEATAGAMNATNATKLKKRTLTPASPCDDPYQGAPSPKDKRAAKCTLAGSKSCVKLQERFIMIQSGLKDSQEKAQEELVALENECETTQKTLSETVEKAEQSLNNYQTKLADATSCENEAAEAGRLANEEFQEMSKELLKMRSQCSSNYQNFETEMCGVKKIRGQLYIKLTGASGKPFFQDCKLSDWTKGECSAECAGGEQTETRTVDTQPQGGAKCLPLSDVRRCNEQPCPVDCKLSTWSGWSSCSAECGGGVQQRLRTVMRAMKHNGNPCGEVSETKGCNVQACENDCQLGDWSPWAKCSKPCDGGSRKRVKHVKIAATGSGSCPAPTSGDRTEFEKCNAQACPKVDAATTIKCNAKMDLILVLDGSGSLGEAGWKATRKAAELIVGAMDPELAQVAVLVYSGPGNWPDVYKCWRDSSINQEKVCRMKWVQHLETNNVEKALTKIKDLSWPTGSTMTSLALMNALAETQLGRQEAQTVVAVITDGKPLSQRATWRAAGAVRKVARLLWVPVTRYAPLMFIRALASRPWRENVVLAKNFETLSYPGFVDHVIADMCSVIAVPPLPTGTGQTNL